MPGTAKSTFLELGFTTLIVLLIGARMVLGVASSPSPRPDAILGQQGERASPSPPRLILVAESGGEVAATEVTAGADYGASATPPLSTDSQAIRRFVRSLGHDALPLLVTVDAEGHIVRVRPFHSGDQPLSMETSTHVP